MNLPKLLTGDDNKIIEYVYDANGQKLVKIDTEGTETHYAGAFVYKGSSLDFVLHSEGVIQVLDDEEGKILNEQAGKTCRKNRKNIPRYNPDPDHVSSG